MLVYFLCIFIISIIIHLQYRLWQKRLFTVSYAYWYVGYRPLRPGQEEGGGRCCQEGGASAVGTLAAQ